MRMNDFNSIMAYGTSEGVEKEWDTRGRGRKSVSEVPRPRILPAEEDKKAIHHTWESLGNRLEKMNVKMEDAREARTLLGHTMHFLKELGHWYIGGTGLYEALSHMGAVHSAVGTAVPAVMNAVSAGLTAAHPFVHALIGSTVIMHGQGSAGNASQYGQTGWQYGKRSLAPAAGYIPTRSLAGFPASPRGGRGGGRGMGMGKPHMPKMPRTPLGKGTATGMKVHAPKVAKVVKPVAPKALHLSPVKSPKPNIPKAPSVSRPHIANPGGGGFGRKKLEAMEGEPMGGAYGHLHLDPAVWFRPPSLTQREKGKAWQHAIPVDQPGEKNNKFLDVTKRNSKDTEEFRMGLLKRKGPGGLPPQIPVRTTLIEPHSAVYLPGPTYASAAENRRNLMAPRRRFTTYGRRGCI